MKQHRSAAMTVSVLTLAMALWLQSSEAAATAGHIVSVVSRPNTRLAVSQGHLYVLDGGNAVYRFVLAQNGLPAMQPDSALYPEGARDLTGLAVDRAGHVFVADGDKGTVSEFAAGASGQQQPISVLNPGNDPDRLNIDSSERLYVHYGVNHEIAIFAKGAHGNDPPISIVPDYTYVVDYVIAANGMLYSLGPPVAEYDDPLNSPTQPNRVMWPDGNFFNYTSTLALDGATNRLYVQFYVGIPKYWNKVNYDVRSATGGVPFTRTPWIYTADCGSAGQNIVFGTKIIKSYLIVSCNYNPGVVFVYRKDEFGRQRTPVETVGQGTLCCPWEMAVGP